MKYSALSLMGCGLALSACASQPPAVPPRVTTEVPVAETTPPPLTGAQLLARQPPEVQTAIKQHAPNSKWPVYRTGSSALYPFNQQPEALIDCAPLRTTDLQLQPGETITDVALGDSERWMATPAASGDPRNAVPHLAVKPQAAGIATNLTIYTTNHIYHLLLRSRGHALEEVEFYYPDELLTAMKAADTTAANAPQESVDPANAGSANVDPSRLNFAYAISGPNVPWRPTRAYDDGARVFIQMPAAMKSSEAPALLINAGSGTQMVNYRVAGNYYVVDRLFSEATMVAGVGREQDRVTISATDQAR
jgi:type IV secretion system protein VirB9